VNESVLGDFLKTTHLLSAWPNDVPLCWLGRPARDVESAVVSETRHIVDQDLIRSFKIIATPILIKRSIFPGRKTLAAPLSLTVTGSLSTIADSGGLEAIGFGGDDFSCKLLHPAPSRPTTTTIALVLPIPILPAILPWLRQIRSPNKRKPCIVKKA